LAGIQFHPELSARHGAIEKSVGICGAKQYWVMSDFIKHEIIRIRKLVGGEVQVIGLSQVVSTVRWWLD
jgi:GMP synthase (glutamine-hydrolysing)